MINVVRRSIFFSALERYGGVIFFVASTAVLSRLLTPHEFGIYALVNAVSTLIAASFQEFGGANYLIQKPSLSTQDIRSAFTVTLCLSVLFAAALFLLRDVAAWFFSEDGLKIGIAVSTLNLLVSPFLITKSTLLRRDMAFATLAWCNLAGAFIAAVISIALATLNYSFMAPIWGAVIGNVVVLVLLITPRHDVKIFCPSFCGYGDIFHFGAYSSGTAIINVLYNLAPQLILARIIDFNAVGLYGRASNITQLFDKWVIQVLNPVILPAISAHKRAGGDLKRTYLDAIELIAVVQWPFLLFFALMADPIIGIWLGETWSEIVPLIRMLCIASLSLFAACLTYPVLVALGFVRDTLVSSLISLPPSLLMIFVASFFGVQAVAACALVTLPFQAIVALFFVGRRLKIGPADLMRATVKSGIVTGYTVGGALVSMVIMEFSSGGPVIGLVSASIFAAAAWWLGLLMTKHRLLGVIRMATDGMAVASPTIASATLQKIAMRAGARTKLVRLK
jgi:O-antigen/teichoic acid export membrane protein